MFKGTYSPIGLAQLQHEIDISCRNVRRLFRTQGMLLGTGARSAQEGDEVWILAGAKVPYIAKESERETSTYWGGICPWDDAWRSDEAGTKTSKYHFGMI
jgi:hypothetical protein